MARRFEYTALAQRYTARFPVVTYLGTQVNFWILANILLVVIFQLSGNIISEIYAVAIADEFGVALIVATIMGAFYGVGIGATGYYLDRKIFRKLSLGRVLLLKTFISVLLVAIVLSLLRFVLFDLFIAPTLKIAGVALTEKSWDYLFSLLLIYYFFMTMVISFINQVNRKYGPGVLVPLLLGKYRTPKEEEKIFMFMDLKSSTSIAEKLGHIRYSAFLRDCFTDINEVLYPFCAQVYQYVGDEIVVMWPAADGLRNNFCISFYFAVRKQFQDRASYYASTYNFQPVFKAGLHMGKVTAVEIGEIKKDIAYHGDTLNTAARIQSVCNEYQKDFLVSECLMKRIASDERIKVESLGEILLKGKSAGVGVVSLTVVA